MIYTKACPSLELQTRPRFRPVSLSFSMPFLLCPVLFLPATLLYIKLIYWLTFYHWITWFHKVNIFLVPQDCCLALEENVREEKRKQFLTHPNPSSPAKSGLQRSGKGSPSLRRGSWAAAPRFIHNFFYSLLTYGPKMPGTVHTTLHFLCNFNLRMCPISTTALSTTRWRYQSKYKLLHFLTTKFFAIKEGQAFNRDRCCHLAFCYSWFSSIS
jgi:hypothetical protein